MRKEDAFEVSEVVNWLLSTYDSNQFSLTNLKLNKLVYFMHGISLAREDVPLIRNRFECWQNGPVVASLYHRLKRFGYSEVTQLISYQNYETGAVGSVSSERVEARLTPVIRRATDYFVAKSTSWLVEKSHAESGPWSRNYANRDPSLGGVSLADHEIKEHFVNIYGGRRLN